VQIFNK
nr:Chain C, VQIFNK [Homo sapiens]